MQFVNKEKKNNFLQFDFRIYIIFLISEIKMPSSQFYLEVQNSMISSLDARTSVATALELGDTEIKLIDKSIL